MSACLRYTILTIVAVATIAGPSALFAQSMGGKINITSIAFIDVNKDGQQAIFDPPVVGASVIATELSSTLTPIKRLFTQSDEQGNFILRNVHFPLLVSVCPPSSYNLPCSSKYLQKPYYSVLLFPF